jgi:rhodanese-related sulfurtransferase
MSVPTVSLWEVTWDSINIPLNEIPERVEELKKLNAPLILCCASGNRSGQDNTSFQN